MSKRPQQQPYLEREFIDGVGVYAIFPFDLLDESNSGVFKIGMASKSLDNRLRAYHTYLPKGFYMKCFLKTPHLLKRKMNAADYYRMIEKEIFEDVKLHGGKAVFIQNRKHNDGETEWVYVNEKIIYDAFNRAYKKYGGDFVFSDLGATLRRNVHALRRNQVFKGETFF